VRHVEPDTDFPALADLISTVNVHDGVDWLPTAETLAHDWEHTDGADVSEDVVLAEVSGALVGYAEHSWRVRGEHVFHHLHVAVLPDIRRRGLGRALLAWAEARVASGLAGGGLGDTLALPHVLSGYADLDITAVKPWATAAGYAADGYGVLMTRPLADPIPDVQLPTGIELRPVRAEDHRRIWDADTEAFQDLRDPSVRTESDFAGWFTQPNLDTGLWLVAWDGAEVAGSVMNFVWPEENARLGLSRGWLEHVSVRRPWRKRGLATALIAGSLRLLKDLDLEEAALGADAENLTGAVHVYEALGFRRVRTAANYRKPVEVPLPALVPDGNGRVAGGPRRSA
jgi:ribosomal protein S18 acetylase RimI-like enzyme